MKVVFGLMLTIFVVFCCRSLYWFWESKSKRQKLSASDYLTLLQPFAMCALLVDEAYKNQIPNALHLMLLAFGVNLFAASLIADIYKRRRSASLSPTPERERIANR